MPVCLNSLNVQGRWEVRKQVEVEEDKRDAYYISTKGGAPCVSIAKRARIFPLTIVNVWDKTNSSFLLTKLS